MVLRPGPQSERVDTLKNLAGIRVAASSDFENAAVTEADIAGADGILLEHIDVMIVNGDPGQIAAIRSSVADLESPILSIEPEEYVIPFDFLTQGGREYLRGYGDAVQSLMERLMTGAPPMDQADVEAVFSDTAAFTWGLQATKVDGSACTGAGIRVCVLDTGFDLLHPDFVGRSVVTQSFVPGVPTVQDGHGHGTHCIGTSCGPKTPAGGVRRYGIAHMATIMVGKVLSDAGSGQDGWILAGINWAVQNKAAIISMSLGSPVAVGGTFKAAYESAAQAALNANCLIVAAAGNSANQPVGSPANCPSIMAVAAVDSSLQHAPFSSIGINPSGGEVNIAAPGVNVFSSVKMPSRYTMMSGTSMATPHVAGIAALQAQSSGLRGQALWNRLTSTTQNIGQTPQLIGSGLAQAPLCRLIHPPFPWPVQPIKHPPIHPPIHFPPLPIPPIPTPPPPPFRRSPQR
ncbi:MAG: S8 family serine peptidase [bacterium]